MTRHPTSDVSEARALLILDQLPRVGLVMIQRLVETFGSGERALTAPHALFVAVAGLSAARGRRDAALIERVERALADAERLGIHVSTWHSPEYPERLRHLADPPPVLFMKGSREILERPSVTVVGARRATVRSRDLAERLGSGLAAAGVTAVSGLALGVDGAVHKGALGAGGDTIAVLGTGADVAYPSSHRRLHHQILERGLIVSEFLPGTPALPHHFPRRNRILAALSSATVVVEAGVRSGSLITVDHALDLGRDVWVVPGPIERSTCAGSNRLLLDGARALLSIPDFLEAISGSAPSSPAVGDAVERRGGVEGKLLSALGEEPLTVDELAVRVGVPVPDALVILTVLELGGEVARVPGMRFRRAA